MKLGVAIEETWDFFREIYADLNEHYAVELFQRSAIRSPVFQQRLMRRQFDRDMRTFLQRNDVVLFEWASGLLAAASHMPKSCGIVTRLHRYEMYKWADAVNWQNVDAVILVSEAKRDEFVRRFPQQADKAVVIPEAVSLERFTVQERAFSGELGIMSHMRPRKRIYDLVLTFQELLQEGSDVRLHVAGGEAAGFAEYYVAVHRLVERMGIADRVAFYGHVDEPEEWYRGIDIMVSNSYSEGLQVVPLEAIASGCFVLCHHWEGAEDLFLSEDLFLTNCELKEKIREFAAMSEPERQGRRLAQRTAVYERCDVDKTKNDIRRVIESVGDERASTRGE